MVGCSAQVQKGDASTRQAIDSELSSAISQSSRAVDSGAVAEALLPPLKIEVPPARAPIEERFSVAFTNLPAQQFFHGIVSGTRYSMLVHPDVQGTISVNLKDVTVLEALEAVRDLYGYDYEITGNRILIKPHALQTRVFQINYLAANRRGTSDIRVTSGSVSDTVGSGSTPGSATTASNTQSQQTTHNSSRISTESSSDFWAELGASLEALVGNKDGRSVVVNPKSGVVVVRGMWNELRNVSTYLKATQLAVDRQVILEAKIIEVELSDGFQSGINWAVFRNNPNSAGSIGLLSPGSSLATRVAGEPVTISSPELSALPGVDFSSVSSNANSLFGMAFQTSNFAALLSFLESQGNVHVLSSPRIATMNNQKAVLKVGRDEFFLTNISTTTSTSGNTTTTTPTFTVQPFFSGVALDVTPQIDEMGNIMLHIHPSVSNVSTVNRRIDLGSLGDFTLPLASSAISETDSLVRGQDGQIVVIGGLMRQASISDRSQLPGAGDIPGVGALFRNTRQSVQKRELVILLKPTIVQGSNAWEQDLIGVQDRVKNMERGSRPRF